MKSFAAPLRLILTTCRPIEEKKKIFAHRPRGPSPGIELFHFDL